MRIAWALALAAITTAPAGAAPPRAVRPVGVSVIHPGPTIERAMAGGQTGVFLLFRADLVHDGTIETLAVLDNGKLQDLLARRDSAVLARGHTTLPKALRQNQIGQMLAFGIDVPIVDAARRERFQDIVRTAGAPGPASACPGATVQGPAARSPGPSLVFIDTNNRPFLTRWGFSYEAGRSFTFTMGSTRASWCLSTG